MIIFLTHSPTILSPNPSNTNYPALCPALHFTYRVWQKYLSGWKVNICAKSFNIWNVFKANLKGCHKMQTWYEDFWIKIWGILTRPGYISTSNKYILNAKLSLNAIQVKSIQFNIGWISLIFSNESHSTNRESSLGSLNSIYLNPIEVLLLSCSVPVDQFELRLSLKPGYYPTAHPPPPTHPPGKV